MAKTKIVFRADGNSSIGLGHVIRSLALAEMLKTEFEYVFAIQEPAQALEEKIKAVCPEIMVLPVLSSVSKMFENELLPFLTGTEIVVLDGYTFGTDYQQQLKNTGCKVVCLDDVHAYHFVADAIINHAISANKADYSAEVYTKFYLGLDYALIRGAFQKHAALRQKNTYKKNNRVFICLGGADPENELFKILEILKNSPDSIENEYKVVVGSAYRFYDELLDSGFQQALNLNVYRDLSEAEMYELMLSCASAICSPSSVAIEYLAIGGLLYLHCIAANQQEFYSKLTEQKLAYDFTDFSNKPAANGLEMYNRHCTLIDGNQQERFLAVFKTLLV